MSDYPTEIELSEDAQVIVFGFGSKLVEEKVDSEALAPLKDEWDGIYCFDCEQPMANLDLETVESLSINVGDGRKFHWHPLCWLNPTKADTDEFHKIAGWMQL